MSAEQDAGKNGKKLGSVISLTLIVILAGGYWLLSWLHQDKSGADSAVNLNGTASSAGTLTTETPRYRELLKASNNQGAAEAARNNTTFIASMPVGLDSPVSSQERRPSPPPKTTTVTPAPPPSPQTSSATEKQADEKRQEKLQKLLTRISLAQGKGLPPAQARSYGNGSGISATEAPVVPASLSTVQPRTPQQQFIPALTRVGASMETAIDSDNLNSQVVATIPAGVLAGARLHSDSVKLAGDGLEIHFTRMSWQGMVLNVNAYAQRETDLMSSVASDVNHRWGTHIVLPAILGGMGNVGSLYKESNTQILQTNMSTVTGRAGKPDAGTVAGVIAGGTAEKGSEVLSQEMAREPYRQVLVNQREVISVLFVDAVGTDDIASKKGTTTATTAAIPSPVAAEQLSETRLQDAIARRRAEIRRQYGGTTSQESNE